MKAKLDQKAQSLYIQVTENQVAFTEELVPDEVNMDYDDKSNLVGIEFIGIKELRVDEELVF